ncbi:hypothetical protein PII48_06795 [Serratia sp. 21NM0010]|uniref:hypothetical protein n=1 Tax=Serratia TaxID=613 RepID=UPI001865B989|nr:MULTISPECIES: hypothetical protein [Serratia]MDB6448578.1 hypothetical protein [Serratia sp. 21NM0010]
MADKFNGNVEIAPKNESEEKGKSCYKEKKDCEDGDEIKGGDGGGGEGRKGEGVKEKRSRVGFIAYSILAYFGALLIVTSIVGINLPSFIANYYPLIVGVISLAIGVYNAQILLAQKKRKSELKFTDVDRKYNKIVASNGQTIVKMSADAKNNMLSNVRVIGHNIENISQREYKTAAKNKREQDTFITYFKSMKVLIERKASAADEKASILLEKGTSYTKFGIIFYLISIFIWQFIFWKQGFKVDFAWGIASCSFLFLFIEFLSAWFLKQYKNFTDTSTYLIKVKSTLDRYMLMYMIGFENKDKEIILIARKALLEMLSEEIQWPDTKTINNNDNGYAKDALASLSDAIKSMSEGMHANKNKN